MAEPLSLLPTDFFDQPWVIPIIGLAAAGLAFVVGRLFVARPARAARRRAEPAPPPAEPTPEDDVFLHGSSSDRRSSPRRRGNSVAVTLKTDDDQALHGWVLDRSMGGLCLLVETEVAEGTILNARARHAPETAPWVAIQVRGCRRHQNEWELRCQFVQTPSWSVLLLFG